MAKTTADDQLMVQLAQRLNQLALEGINMLDGMCRRSPIIDFQNLPQEAEQNIQLGGGIHKSEKIIDVKASFRITVGKSTASHIEVAANFILRYRFSGDAPMSQDELELFCRRIGGMAAWPYWREFVQSSVTRMGLPPLTVPMMNPMTLAKAPPDKATASKIAAQKKNVAGRRKSK